MRLGKRAPKFDRKRLKLAAYLPPVLPDPPESQDWIGAITDWGMMLNDRIGDCTIAALAHAVQTWTANASPNGPVRIADSDIFEAYKKWAGYNPGDSRSDQGAFEIDILNHWRDEGLAGHFLKAYADPNWRDRREIKNAILLLGGIYVGVALPRSAQTENIWFSTHDTPGSWGGHAMWLPAYNPTGPLGITWGAVKQMTWDWFEKYCDEAHALVSPDFIAASGSAPSGFKLARLEEDLLAIAAVAA